MDGPNILKRLLSYLPLNPDEEKQLLERFVSVTRATLKGSLLIGVIQGGVTGVAFWVAGVPGAAFWGTVVVLSCFGDQNARYATYHDEEWGVPVHDDRRLFEFLILEGAQAGLSWETILNKRERYREVFEGFDPEKVARFTPDRLEILLRDPGIVRNRLKVAGAARNAQAFLEVQAAFGSFDGYAWAFVDGQPRQNRWRSMRELPARTAESTALSEDLKRRGFTFVGPTIMYAWMQAVGLVNDYLAGCPRHEAVARLV